MQLTPPISMRPLTRADHKLMHYESAQVKFSSGALMRIVILAF